MIISGGTGFSRSPFSRDYVEGWAADDPNGTRPPVRSKNITTTWSGPRYTLLNLVDVNR